MKFVIVTEELSGLGFAQRLIAEGHQVLMAYKPNSDDIDYKSKPDQYALVGKGIVKKVPLDKVMKKRADMHDWYWIWDSNHNVPENEVLRKEGFKVLGGGKFAHAMEHDRDYTLKLAAKYGLRSPLSHKFSDAASAIAFLQAHEDTAYVYKPDEGEKYETYVPIAEEAADKNKEVQVYLQAVKPHKPFVLQEFKDGVETNVEVWFAKGEPKFAFMCMEAKRKDNGDRGELAGCAFDIAFVIPLASQAVTETIGKLYPLYKKMNYTGFADANFIAAKDGIWFFEKCERFGYNSHPNLLFNLNKDELGKTLASLIDGDFKPNFSPGFGASVTLHTDHPHGGLPIQFPEKYEKDIYFFSAYKENDFYFTSGYYESVLVVTAFGYTIPTAWENLLAKVEKIRFPGRSYRDDGDKTNYPSSPIRRYEALTAMDYI
jgi:phosphoribosylamine-glycine ligase